MDLDRIAPKHEAVNVSEAMKAATEPPPERITRPTSGVPIAQAKIAKSESRPRE